MEVVYARAMDTCPHCQQTRYQIQDGLTGAGSQRVRCRSWGKRSTAQPKPHGYPPELRQQALKLDVDGMNVRRIARVLDVHHQSVINWINAGADHVPELPPTPAQIDTVELDALYTFVGHKKTRLRRNGA